MTTSNIDINNLTIGFQTAYGPIEAVKDLSVVFKSSEVTGIIGESGSGKSLLGMSILSLLSKEANVEGQCIYHEEDLFKSNKKRLRDLRGKEIAFVPQNPINALNPVLTIGRQVTEHTALHLKMGKQEARKLAMDYLGAFGLVNVEKLMKAYPFQLSGGMNQVVVFVMGVICKPKFLIADEPTKGLDSKIRKTVYERLLFIKNRYVKSMILISHDLYFAHKICDRIIVMYRGQIVEIGKSDDLINKPKHPYTEKLIQSSVRNGMQPIQRLDDKVEDGCSFYNYCSYRQSDCLKQVALRNVGDSLVRCIR